MIKIKIAPALVLVVPLLLGAKVHGGVTYEQGKAVPVLGTKMGATVQVRTTVSQQSETSVKLQAMGRVLQALFALTTPPNTIDGVTYTEVYSFGKKVFSKSHYFYTDGTQFSVGLAPTQIRVPFIVYPVGPLTLHVDGGARFQANLSAKNMTNISFPIEYSEPGMQLSAVAGAAGFVEGYARLFIIRGGVGGQLDLVDARLDVNSRFSLKGEPTLVTASAIAQFLKGRLYAFLDMGFFGWRRLLDETLYAWNGYCFATADRKCPGK